MVETWETLKKKLDQVQIENRVPEGAAVLPKMYKTGNPAHVNPRRPVVHFQGIQGMEIEEEEEDRRQLEEFKAQQQAKRQAEREQRNQ